MAVNRSRCILNISAASAPPVSIRWRPPMSGDLPSPVKAKSSCGQLYGIGVGAAEQAIKSNRYASLARMRKSCRGSIICLRAVGHIPVIVHHHCGNGNAEPRRSSGLEPRRAHWVVPLQAHRRRVSIFPFPLASPLPFFSRLCNGPDTGNRLTRVLVAAICIPTVGM